MYSLVCDCSSWVQFAWNDQFVALEYLISLDSNHPCYCTFCIHVLSEVQILINDFIFLPVDGQLQKVTDKLNRNLPITMRHVVLWSKKYKTSCDCNLNFRGPMFMKGIGWWELIPLVTTIPQSFWLHSRNLNLGSYLHQVFFFYGWKGWSYSGSITIPNYIGGLDCASTRILWNLFVI